MTSQEEFTLAHSLRVRFILIQKERMAAGGPGPGIRKPREMNVVPCLLTPLYSVRDPSPWDGAAHPQAGPCLLSVNLLWKHRRGWGQEVSFHGEFESIQVDKEDGCER